MSVESRRATAWLQPTDRDAQVFQLAAPAGRHLRFLPLFALSLGIGLTPVWGLFLAWEIGTTVVAAFRLAG